MRELEPPIGRSQLSRSSRRPRLYHSNVSIHKSLTQYDFLPKKCASLDAIHRLKTTLSPTRSRKRKPFIRKPFYKQENIGERLPLVLPSVEPDVNLDFDITKRDASATTFQTTADVKEDAEVYLKEEHMSRGGRDSQASDEYFSFDVDDVTARNNLYKIGQFQMEHNWLFHEDLQRKQLEFNKKSTKLNICVADDDVKDTIDDRMTEIKAMMKPKADTSHLLETMDPAQREIIRVSTISFDLHVPAR